MKWWGWTSVFPRHCPRPRVPLWILSRGWMSPVRQLGWEQAPREGGWRRYTWASTEVLMWRVFSISWHPSLLSWDSCQPSSWERFGTLQDVFSSIPPPPPKKKSLIRSSRIFWEGVVDFGGWAGAFLRAVPPPQLLNWEPSTFAQKNTQVAEHRVEFPRLCSMPWPQPRQSQAVHPSSPLSFLGYKLQFQGISSQQQVEWKNTWLPAY